jgi:hydroxyacylglutathione hydrolase
MRIAKSIALVGSSRFGLSNPYDCSIYAVDCGDGIVLVDTGSGLEPELVEANMRQDGFDPDRIVMILITHTHADHAGGCYWWKQRTGCHLAVPEGERGWIEGAQEIGPVLEVAKRAGIYPQDYELKTAEVDVGLRDGQVLEVGRCQFRAIEVAGHIPHHMCYEAELDGRRVLFSGDAVMYGGALLLQNVPGCSLDDYRRDMPKLADLAIDSLLPGHGIFIVRNGQEHIDRAIGYLAQLGVPPNFATMCPKIIPALYRKNG